MHDRDLDERSRRLSDRVDAFGRALDEAGVDRWTASRLLETAATAALHALTLELLLAPAAQPPTAPAARLQPPAEPAVDPSAAPPLRIAEAA